MIVFKVISVVLLGLILITIGFVIGVIYSLVALDDYVGFDNLEEMEHKYEVSNYSKDS